MCFFPVQHRIILSEHFAPILFFYFKLFLGVFSLLCTSVFNKSSENNVNGSVYLETNTEFSGAIIIMNVLSLSKAIFGH